MRFLLVRAASNRSIVNRTSRTALDPREMLRLHMGHLDRD